MRSSPVTDIGLVILAASAAFVFYSLLGGSAPYVLYVFNAFSIIVVVFAIKRGAVFGGVLGTVCGLLQDSFSFGVFGVAGLTKTLLGLLAGYVSAEVDVTSPRRSGLFILVISFLEVMLWMALVGLVRGQRLNLQDGLLLLQPFATAFLAGLALWLERLARSRGF
jgi:rod shape-determining protein MreD